MKELEKALNKAFNQLVAEDLKDASEEVKSFFGITKQIPTFPSPCFIRFKFRRTRAIIHNAEVVKLTKKTLIFKDLETGTIDRIKRENLITVAKDY